jgi:hypothetical protein
MKKGLMVCINQRSVPLTLNQKSNLPSCAKYFVHICSTARHQPSHKANKCSKSVT